MQTRKTKRALLAINLILAIDSLQQLAKINRKTRSL
jgi:uncharacterized pyridoxal phosphate-containing UPF0001 family protein